jgi:hypothetical protein
MSIGAPFSFWLQQVRKLIPSDLTVELTEITKPKAELARDSAIFNHQCSELLGMMCD